MHMGRNHGLRGSYVPAFRAVHMTYSRLHTNFEGHASAADGSKERERERERLFLAAGADDDR